MHFLSFFKLVEIHPIADIFYYGNVDDIYSDGFSVCYNGSKIRITIGDVLGDIKTKYFGVKVEMCGE